MNTHTSNTKEEGMIIETAERIVIDYANCSGREDKNRAAFRGMVTGHLNKLVASALDEYKKKVVREIEKKMLEVSKDKNRSGSGSMANKLEYEGEIKGLEMTLSILNTIK